ncbi:hypothetical protein CTI12_AA505490 [Artemisia annua]|uniref:Uncharacterized protein n=1 Tax=Artemisia annua TaxID=35608 RepID=A0A2U1LCK5_ARTAN|nr:hypothetical protein CTI12_AA505490 [Artemisia annua]
MSSAPDFPTNNHASIVSGEYDAQWTPSPEFEGRKDTSYTYSYSQQRTTQNMYKVDAPPPDYETKGSNSVASGASGLGLTDKSIVKAAPGMEVVVHDNPSGAILNYKTTSTSYNPAPGFTGIGPQNQSKVDEKSANTTPGNQQDVVGISLVGRRFKDVNPTAYYVEKN